MKYFNILLLLFTISLIACDDADDKVKRTSNTAIIHEGTRFILYDKLYETLDTIVVKETRQFTGTTSIEPNGLNVGYSINGLGYKFNTYNVFNNIYFNFEGDRLVWIGSSSINSGFFFKGLNVEKLNIKNIELDFDKGFTVGDHYNYFASSNDNYFMLIEGKFSFREKGK